MEKKVAYLGGAGGLGKTTLAQNIESANTENVTVLNCTKTLMEELGVRSRSDLHHFTPAQKLAASTETLRKRIEGTSADLIIIDGHYAVETEPGKYETGCFPEGLSGRIDQAFHVTATPEDIKAIRMMDMRKRGTSMRRIEAELDANKKEVDRLRDTSIINASLIPLELQSLETRWNLHQAFTSLQSTAPFLQTPQDLGHKNSHSTDPVYPFFRSSSIDELVVRGAQHIFDEGVEIKSRSGSALQAYNVTYHLDGSRDRVHTLRNPGALRYLSREFQAYFKGSLKADDLVHASRFWNQLADKSGMINSNYGHYIFRQKISAEANVKNQFEWVIKQLSNNPNSRKATININQPKHKTNTKDFPCTISLQFFIQDNALNCVVFSRSTDIFTGLPYDMGFFSFINELICQCLKDSEYPDLTLGYTSMRTNFTQIYRKTRRRVADLLQRVEDREGGRSPIIMPPAEGYNTYDDIMQGTATTEVVQWINEMAEEAGQYYKSVRSRKTNKNL